MKEYTKMRTTAGYRVTASTFQYLITFTLKLRRFKIYTLFTAVANDKTELRVLSFLLLLVPQCTFKARQIRFTVYRRGILDYSDHVIALAARGTCT